MHIAPTSRTWTLTWLFLTLSIFSVCYSLNSRYQVLYAVWAWFLYCNYSKVHSHHKVGPLVVFLSSRLNLWRRGNNKSIMGSLDILYEIFTATRIQFVYEKRVEVDLWRVLSYVFNIKIHTKCNCHRVNSVNVWCICGHAVTLVLLDVCWNVNKSTWTQLQKLKSHNFCDNFSDAKCILERHPTLAKLNK